MTSGGQQQQSSGGMAGGLASLMKALQNSQSAQTANAQPNATLSATPGMEWAQSAAAPQMTPAIGYNAG